jgi:hypothetical protein
LFEDGFAYDIAKSIDAGMSRDTERERETGREARESDYRLGIRL